MMPPMADRSWRDIIRRGVSGARGRTALITLGAIALLYAGMWLAYAIFYVAEPIESFAKAEGHVERAPFRFDGVTYFDGHELAGGQSVLFRYMAPRMLANRAGAELEFFIRIDGMPDAPTIVNGPLTPSNDAEQPLGTLHVRLGKSEHAIELEQRTFHRFRLPLDAETSRKNQFEVRFDVLDGIARTDGEPVRLTFATNVHASSMFGFAGLFGFIGIALLGAAGLTAPRIDWRLIIVLGGTIIACWFFQSGGFTSNAYFNGDENRIAAMAGQFDKLMKNGSFSDTVYRQGGTLVVPAVWLMIEGTRDVLKGDNPERLPGIRYLTWAWFLVAFLVLQAALYRSFGAWLPLIAGLLYATHAHTYEYGLFKIDSDAFIFPWCMFIIASTLRMNMNPTRGRWWAHAIWIAVCAAGLGSLKSTPIVFVGLIPVVHWVALFVATRRLPQRRPVILGALMAGCFIVGGALGTWPHSDNRNIGLEEYPFQDSVLWHLVWAANGHFDDHSAHWMTKNGPLRSDRVAEHLGIPSMTYVRHAQAATDEVYKPQMLNAMRERPGFFYGNFYQRALHYALHFYRSTSQEHHAEWEERERSHDEIINGEAVSGIDAMANLSRYGRLWKVAPMVLVAQISDRTIGLGSDLILITMSIAGIILLRRLDVVILFLGLVAIKFGAGIILHETNRYFAFAHIPMLIGLASVLIAAARCLAQVRFHPPSSSSAP